ncbi:2-oxoglutarate dehydrogenase, E2 component, dihydrolipoamide succinyltransferase [Granulicoccus sp. GXG6511]|uniref:2-oxoglutarate dehydrogenase, E2 component, dihydrolipoamide succinyltransferase n=1 Tax=Granulicoccus sp. GXG6511 TaxID=3381351 RepID=UPI003D7D0EFB
MPTSVTLPALGESVTEGTVSRWLKQVGDTVAADEPLLEVSTDKVDTEIPSPAAGVLLEIKAQEDETVEVGAELAIIGEEGEQPADSGSDDAEPEQDDQSEPEPEPEQDEPEPEEEAEPESEPEPQQTGTAKKKPSGPAQGTEVTLPALGESVTEGTVSRWLKQVGDSVDVDEPLVEISTDKVDTEVPSPVAGTVLELRAQEDDTIDVGAVLAIIGDADALDSGDESDTSDAQSVEEVEDQAEAGDEGGQKPIPAPESDGEAEPEPAADEADDAAEEPAAEEHEAEEDEAAEKPKETPKQPEPAAKQEPEPTKQEPTPAANKVAPRSSGDEGAYVTPLVRKLAAEHGVDLGSLKGTGVGGRIRKQDVLAAAEEAKKAAAAPAAAPAAAKAKSPARTKSDPSAEVLAKRGTTEKLSRMRLTIARRMVESLQGSAQLTATVEVDLTGISRLRAAAKEAFKAQHGASLSYLPFITIAAVEALRHFPKVNATIDTEAKTVTYADAEHIGIAVDTERGLMVPVIHNAGDLNLSGLAKRIAEQADKARTGQVVPDDLVGGTFTITNYGSTGTLFDTPIINQPQVGILGTGALVKRPLVIQDADLGEVIAIRDVMYLSLSYDHRLVDGADASRFLAAMKERLEEADFGAELGV